jgi:protein-S-isoprenylcysteine O-methyltransferase Ste14
MRDRRDGMKLFLALRSLLFLILIPGTVAGYIPWRILRASKQLATPALSINSTLAAGLALLGICVLVVCVWDFFDAGHGTLAPFDPPKRLVVSRLYRFTRNPMYNGVVTLLLGEAWLFHSTSLLHFALLVFIIFHLMVVVYEEPALEEQFADSYRAYRAAVPRWGFTVRSFAGPRSERR